MKNKKIIVFFTTAVVLVVAIVFGSYAYVRDYYHATEEALQLIENPGTDISITKKDDYYEIASNEATAGFIFYPGAKVECEAYVPFLCKLAEEGYLCILADMPCNIAFLDINAADRVREEYPEIDTWYLAGHSLGGAMAAQHAASRPGEYKGLFLLAAYSMKDLSETDIKVMCIYGDRDGVLNKNLYESCKKNLPEDFIENIVSGGNHAGFGYYGTQKGDGEAEITREQQINSSIEVIKFFLEQ